MAVTAWLTEAEVDDSLHKKYPAVLVNTRYWRATAIDPDQPQQQVYYPWAAQFALQGYRLVVADARGTGASFGSRTAEVDQNEVADIGVLIDWVASQPWCDGRVFTTGCSYSAITTLYSLVTSPSALTMADCRAPDFDMYRHLFAPGGVINRWFIETWGAVTAAQDANDVAALYANGYWPAPESGAQTVLGVMPADEDICAYKESPKGEGDLLIRQAVAEHQQNFNIANDIENLVSIDGFLTAHNPPLYDPEYRAAIEQSSVPLVIRCGWHDAGTALGALAIWATFHRPIQVVLGPWNHDGTFLVDPFQDGDGTTAAVIDKHDTRQTVIDSFDRALGRQSRSDHSPDHAVMYLTLGQNRWKTTQQWPLPDTHWQRYYFGEDHQLLTQPPKGERGYDCYQVDPSASTGRFNRWYAQSPNQPVYFPDRSTEDKKLLVYDAAPFTEEIEITGHPVVTLYVCSTASDGHFFVYLEAIDTNGRVRLLTEGQLRGLHRKISTDPAPYKMFGPYHSLKSEDAEPMVAGELTAITFDLLPLSVGLKRGDRLRVAIAGADRDTFDPLAGCEAPELTIERNAVYASCIDLPFIDLSKSE